MKQTLLASPVITCEVLSHIGWACAGSSETTLPPERRTAILVRTSEPLRESLKLLMPKSVQWHQFLPVEPWIPSFSGSSSYNPREKAWLFPRAYVALMTHMPPCQWPRQGCGTHITPPQTFSFLWRLSFLSNYVYACVYMRGCEYSYPWRAAEGIRSSWSWSYRWSWAAGCERWNRTRDLCKINTHSQPLRHSYSSRSVDLFILLPSLPLESLLRLVSTF